MTVLTPANEAELAEAVAEAAGVGTPLEIRGGGTRAGLGRPVQAEATLSTKGLSGISLYEPGALTLVVKAGALGGGQNPQRRLGDDAELALGAADHAEQVIARRIQMRPADLDHLAPGGDQLHPHQVVGGDAVFQAVRTA